MDAAPTIGHALRGLLVWTLSALITVCGLALLWYLMNLVGIYPERGVNLRTQPFSATAMAVAALVVVLTVFYMAMAISLLVLSTFLSRKELKAHFVEQLGPGKALGPFHGWLFERIFRRE
jgi:hypothetical protein